MQAIADGDVDETILAAERHRRLRPCMGEWKEPGTASPSQDQRRDIVHCLILSAAIGISRAVPASMFSSAGAIRFGPGSWSDPRRNTFLSSTAQVGSSVDAAASIAGCADRIGMRRSLEHWKRCRSALARSDDLHRRLRHSQRVAPRPRVIVDLCRPGQSSCRSRYGSSPKTIFTQTLHAAGTT